MGKPLGYMNFDGLAGENNEVEIRIPADRLDVLRRGQYVMLESQSTGEQVLYLARVIRGPFFVPDAVSRDSAYARASILHADSVKFRPDFHGVCTAEILGKIVDEESLALVGSSTRPQPQAAVRALSDEQIERLLGLSGDILIGELSGYSGVQVRFKHSDKRVLPRNLGIFGTVGSGKTNTSQVLVEGASACGWAVLVLDVEGEYIEMDQPSKEAQGRPSFRRLLDHFGVQPAGVEKLAVMHCSGTEPTRPGISQEFGLRFSNSDPYILAEILGFTDAQMDRFLEAYFEQEASLRRQGHRPSAKPGLAGYLIDDEDEGQPGLQLKEVIATVRAKATDSHVQGKVSWQVLLRKLVRLQRYGVYDVGHDLGDYSELLKPKQVTVFDVSNSFNVAVNNIVISDALRGVFKAKLRDRDGKLPPVLIIIEEAHTFVSKHNVARMEATLDTLRDISRRGRKRWISLCFISQQPAHLPSEIYELCNTKIVHQTTGSTNLSALRDSAGGVNPAIWQEVPVLGQGRCLVISPQFRHPLLCDVRPCSSNRRFTD